MNGPRTRRLLFWPILTGFVLMGLASMTVSAQTVNLDHLRHLERPMVIEGRQATAVWIYCEAPDYHLVGDDDEGVACVDDVARAARVYLELYQQTGDEKLLKDLDGLLNFVLALQAPDGEFWNFVWDDGSINAVHRTSQKSLDWWAARGFRALSLAMAILPEGDNALSRDLRTATELTVNRLLEVHGDTLNTTHMGYDKAAEWMLGLLAWRAATGSVRVDGLLGEFGDFVASGYWTPKEKSDGMTYPLHRSWQNIWHSWGMLQVEALARAGKTLGRNDWIEQAVREGSGFQRWLIAEGMWNEFELGESDTLSAKKYSVIAYGVGSLVACQLSLFEVTGDTLFATGAALAAKWFEGDNSADAEMYDPATGRGYDGIIGPGERNLNAGAESTVEALLARVYLSRYAPLVAPLSLLKRTQDATTGTIQFQSKTDTITLREVDDCWTIETEKTSLEQDVQQELKPNTKGGGNP